MKRLIKLTAVMAGLCFIAIKPALARQITDSNDSALRGAIEIDFESQTIGEYDSLTIGGVTFTGDGNHLRIDDVWSIQVGSEGQYLDNGTYEDKGFFNLNITFSTPTKAFGFQWDMAEPNYSMWYLRAYDSSDNLLDTYLLPNTDGSSVGAFVGLAADDISYATLGSSVGYDWISIDNFNYQAIPEPVTMLLLGFGGLALLRKHRAGNPAPLEGDRI